MNLTRLPHETDEELRIRVKKAQEHKAHIRNLKYFLWKLGIKSARSPGVHINLNGMVIHKPGVY